VESQPTFRRHMPSLLAGILLGLFFGPEDGGHMFLRNTGCFEPPTRCYFLEDSVTALQDWVTRPVLNSHSGGPAFISELLSPR
jgi:hypothetical protein